MIRQEWNSASVCISSGETITDTPDVLWRSTDEYSERGAPYHRGKYASCTICLRPHPCLRLSRYVRVPRAEPVGTLLRDAEPSITETYYKQVRRAHRAFLLRRCIASPQTESQGPCVFCPIQTRWRERIVKKPLKLRVRRGKEDTFVCVCVCAEFVARMAGTLMHSAHTDEKGPQSIEKDSPL